MGDHADDALDSMMNEDEFYVRQTGMGIYEDEEGLPLMPVFGHTRIVHSGPGKCPMCGAPTTQRANSKTNNTFYGCTRYPECKGSRSGA